MSAYINAAAADAHDVLSGFRTSLPTLPHVIEAVSLAAAAGFVMLVLNVLF